MKIINQGRCGFRDIRIIKEYCKLENNDIYINKEVAIRYVIQFRINLFIIFSKWITISSWEYLITDNISNSEIDKRETMSKMSALALYNNMIKYGKI